MEGTKAFQVMVIADLDNSEWTTLAIAKRLTSTRPRSYEFHKSPNVKPDIYIVDSENEKAMERWCYMCKQQSAPTVFLLSTEPSEQLRHEFRRPMMPSRMLPLVKVLDQVTVQELGYLPELRIGDNTSIAPETVDINTRQKQFSALVVDDSCTIQTQVGLGLRMYGVTADFADNAEKAYELLKHNTYDIAFLDVILPGGIDGYQICKTIKKTSKNTTVIMLTSKSSTFDRVRASLAGCNDFLTKPVENTLFQRTLDKYLGDRNKATQGQVVLAKQYS